MLYMNQQLLELSYLYTILFSESQDKTRQQYTHYFIVILLIYIIDGNEWEKVDISGIFLPLFYT